IGRGLCTAPKALGKATWTVLTKFTKSTIVQSLSVATIFASVTWLELTVQAWTREKDYLDYCQRTISGLISMQFQNCRRAMDGGLSKPWLVVPAFLESSTAATELTGRNQLAVIREEFLQDMQEEGGIVAPGMLQPLNMNVILAHTAVIWLLCFALAFVTMSFGKLAARRLIGSRTSKLELPAFDDRSIMSRDHVAVQLHWRTIMVLATCLATALAGAVHLKFRMQRVRNLQKLVEADFVQFCAAQNDDALSPDCSAALALEQNISDRWTPVDAIALAVVMYALVVVTVAVHELLSAWSRRQLLPFSHGHRTRFPGGHEQWNVPRPEIVSPCCDWTMYKRPVE
ncbi:hypothetical protein K458DRAFT_463158, partial [Lentithecium fluviatile CBS 122367]